MKKILLSFFILITVNLFPVQAQKTYELTLDDAIEIARNQSYTMLRLIQELKIAEYNLVSSTSRFKTHINLNLTLPQYSEKIEQWQDSTGVSFYPLKQLGYSANLLINQPLPTNGNIYIQTGLSGVDDYYWDKRSANLNTRIGFSQPLDAFYGYNTIRANYQRARLAYEESEKVMKRQELYLVYRISEYYYALLSAQKRTEIAKLDLDRQMEAYEISKNKFEAGLIREVDALQMEVDLAQAQTSYENALYTQESSLNSFKELLGIELDADVLLSSDLNYQIISVDTEKAVQLALQNRSEIRESDINLQEQELNIKQQKAAGMIKASLEAYFGKSGVNRQDIDNSLGSTISNTFSDFGDSRADYGIGFTISIPILDWGENRALVRAAKARYKNLEYGKIEMERSIETEVRNLVASLGMNLRSLQRLEKNVAVAEKSFGITLQRYSDGDIDSQALSLERTRLNTAYTTHLSAYIAYQLNITSLMRSTLYDFLNEEVVK